MTIIASEEVGLVYFLANMDKSTVKIGFTTNLKKRVAVLQTGNHDRLEVCAFISAPQVVERLLQQSLEPFRIRNEWFDHDACVDDLIRKIEDFEIERGLSDGNFSPTISAVALAVVLERWKRDWPACGQTGDKPQ